MIASARCNSTVKNMRLLRSFGFARTAVLAGLVALLGVMLAPSSADAQSSVRPPSGASTPGEQQAPTNLPGGAGLGGAPQYDTEMWRKVREGASGNAQQIGPGAAVLVDSSGSNWQILREGDYTKYGAYGLGGILLLLALFFLLRGRIKVDAGMSGSTITRFTDVERAGHWLLAVSFIILAVSGLNIVYGKHVLMPVMGKELFASFSIGMKWAHNYVAFAFMVGLVLTFIMWVAQNIPNRYDAIWLLRGGGMIGGGHPPAKKFNAGQKILFWLVMLSGVSLSLSGIALLWPFEFPMFAKTFAFLNQFGLNLPTELSANQEQQYATLWHGGLAIFMTIVVFAHIYIGTIGMQGAFSAMGSGEVDVNWAKEHHNIWAKEVLEKEREEITGGRVQPAE
ncbi:MAG: formate dehydrogenase subunit gamma [Pseudomonadota bacterium]